LPSPAVSTRLSLAHLHSEREQKYTV